MKLGFVGIGRMGEPMVLRLRSANFPVVVWNRTRARLATVVAAGAEPVETLPELAMRADAILTMVTDDAAVESVYSEDHGLLKSDVRGKIFADLSTILPDTVKRVATAVFARGGAFVDAPVAGT